jgi:hypothetical protein
LGGGGAGAGALGVVPDREDRPDDDEDEGVRAGVAAPPALVGGAGDPGCTSGPMIATDRRATSPALADAGWGGAAHELRPFALRRPETAAFSIWPSRRALTWRIRATWPVLWLRPPPTPVRRSSVRF